jgi:hypothetical protein
MVRIPSLEGEYNNIPGCIVCRKDYNPVNSDACDYDGFCSKECEDKFWLDEK